MKVHKKWIRRSASPCLGWEEQVASSSVTAHAGLRPLSAGPIRHVAGVQCCPCLVAWLVADESSRWSVWEYMQISLSSCHLRLRESPGHWTLDKQNGERFHAGSNFVTTHEKLRFGSIELLKFSNKGETLLQWWCSIMEHLKHTPFFSS